MKKIADFFRRNRVTLMLVPQSNRSIRRIKFNLVAAFSILVALIIANVVLLTNTIYNQTVADRLTGVNTELESSLTEVTDKINSLQSIALHSEQQIDMLRDKLSQATGLVDERLSDIEQAEAQLARLIELFNEQTNSDVKPPVSRSFNRAPAAVLSAGSEEESPFTDIVVYVPAPKELTVIDEANILLIQDEVSDILNEKTDSLLDLAKEMEHKLTYLDARPDRYPTYGTFSSPFGYRIDPVYGGTAFHNGIDISNKVGTPIYAAGSGVVTFSGYKSTYGYLLLVDHGYGYVTAYAHCSKLHYDVGDRVSKGMHIADMGATGKVTGPHLHFEIRYQGTAIDPLTMIE